MWAHNKQAIHSEFEPASLRTRRREVCIAQTIGDGNQQWRWPCDWTGIGSVVKKWQMPQWVPKPCHRGLPFMSERVTEGTDVRVFLSLDGNVTIHQADNVVSLDEHQLKQVIQLLQLAKLDLKNLELGRF